MPGKLASCRLLPIFLIQAFLIEAFLFHRLGSGSYDRELGHKEAGMKRYSMRLWQGYIKVRGMATDSIMMSSKDMMVENRSDKI